MGEKDYETISYEKQDRVATIRLNRPEKMNAINESMAKELLGALKDVKEDPDVKVATTGGCRGKNLLRRRRHRHVLQQARQGPRGAV